MLELGRISEQTRGLPRPPMEGEVIISGTQEAF
jgi:hypothetical protein